MKQPEPGESKKEFVFDLTSGRLCLDFCNTLGGRRTRPKERLNSYGDLMVWGRQAGVLTADDARRLGEAARRHPADAAKTLAEAVALREALFRIFSAVIDGLVPARADMALLNGALSRAMLRLQVSNQADGFGWGWAANGEALDRMLWPVVRSAAEVLVSGDVHRVGRCEGETCAWLFLDTSRNHTRRWCDMRSCGNRAKARRYYARQKAGR
jgi:predicted RNA-binding Zn ribbon-like protein